MPSQEPAAREGDAEVYWRRVVDLERQYLELQTRLHDRFEEVADLTDRLLQSQAEAARLRSELNRAMRRIDDLEGSASWRATRPLRAATGRLQRLRSRGGRR